MLYVLVLYMCCTTHGLLAGWQNKETFTSKQYNPKIKSRASQLPWGILGTATVTELSYLYFKNLCQQCALLSASLKEGKNSLTQILD